MALMRILQVKKQEIIEDNDNIHVIICDDFNLVINQELDT